MTVVRFKNKLNSGDGFNNFITDLFPALPSLTREDFKPAVPVNIRQTETEYLLEVVAPGLNKEDFQISIDKNILTVAAERKEEEKEREILIRNEYKFPAFKRSFTLDEKINAEGISAQYVNGVLTLNLPRKEEVKPSIKQITIQ